ncbi:MAG: hypothetical protein M3342_15140 [Bacteroidota bacterium]|nr:hypothetical protein [Bacteroidota bacterium]
MKRLVYSIFISYLFLSGCYYNNEEELYPNQYSCGASNVTFSGTINSIIVNNCTECHSGSRVEAGVNLLGYANVKTKVSDGSLLGSVTHSRGFHPMPHDRPKLSSCDIGRIKAWINAGAPNN